MRIGAPIFIAAFALLCAGMASTSRSLWENPYSDIQVPLDMTNVHTVDITKTTSAQVQFDANESAKINYNEQHETETNLEKPQVSVRDGVMSIRFDPDGYVQPTIKLPPNIRLIKADNTNFEAIRPVGTLRIETKNGVSWSGDADNLEIISTNPVNQYDGVIQVGSGKINQLSVTSEFGGIFLSESKNIQNIHIRAGKDVSLNVSNALDFKRIHIEPIESPDTTQIAE